MQLNYEWDYHKISGLSEILILTILLIFTARPVKAATLTENFNASQGNYSSELVAVFLQFTNGTYVSLPFHAGNVQSLNLHVIRIDSGQDEMFILKPLPRMQFPIMVRNGSNHTRTQLHASHCHFEVLPAITVDRIKGAASEAESHSTFVSLCDSVLKGTIPAMQQQSQGHSATGELLPISSKQQLYKRREILDHHSVQLLLFCANCTWQLYHHKFWQSHSRSAAWNRSNFQWQRVNLLRRHRRELIMKLKLDIPRKYYTKNGPFVMQLYVIVDENMSKLFQHNELKIAKYVAETFAHVSAVYRVVNLFYTISQLDIHKTELRRYQFSNSNNSKTNTIDLIDRYVKDFSHQFRQNVDCIHLLQGRKGYGSAVGYAMVNVMCRVNHCHGLSVILNNQHQVQNAKLIGYIVSHEIGHNLGLKHQNQASECQPSVCVLRNVVPVIDDKVKFSAKSISALIKFLDSGYHHCLLQPRPETLMNSASAIAFVNNSRSMQPVCGNGIIESGEECDCANCADNNGCCDAKLCKLMPGAECGGGRCCDLQNCKVKPNSSVCRLAKNGECDLPEFCDGKSNTCPPDVYVRDGRFCDLKRGSCVKGLCASERIACMHFQWYYAFPQREHASCRWVTCCRPRHSLNNDECHRYDANTEGLLCGQNRLCIRGQCKQMDGMSRMTNSGKICNERGLLNSNGHCHCNYGYGGAYCNESGNGGSADSGPATWISPPIVFDDLPMNLLFCFVAIIGIVVRVLVFEILLIQMGYLQTVVVFIHKLTAPKTKAFVRCLQTKKTQKATTFSTKFVKYLSQFFLIFFNDDNPFRKFGCRK